MSEAKKKNNPGGLKKGHQINVGRKLKHENVLKSIETRRKNDWYSDREATSKKMSQNYNSTGGLVTAKKWNNLEYKERILAGLMLGQKKRPTSLEKLAIKKIQELDLEFEYVGNGKLFIGGRNPDFVHKTRKICIEVCNYYHHPVGYSEKRIRHFNKYGWICYVFYEDELDRLSELKCKM